MTVRELCRRRVRLRKLLLGEATDVITLRRPSDPHELAKLGVAHAVEVRFDRRFLSSLSKEDQKLLLRFDLDSRSRRLLVMYGAKEVAREAAGTDPYFKCRYLERKDVSAKEIPEVVDDAETLVFATTWFTWGIGYEKLRAFWERAKELKATKKIAACLLRHAPIHLIKDYFEEMYPLVSDSLEVRHTLLLRNTLPTRYMRQVVESLSIDEIKKILSSYQGVCEKAKKLLRGRLESLTGERNGVNVNSEWGE